MNDAERGGAQGDSDRFVHVMGQAVIALWSELPQPLLSQQRQVNRERERAQHRAGADVRGRLLAADMLLAG